MNVCAVVLSLVLGCSGGSESAIPTDRSDSDAWLAEDKFRHLTLSFAATQMAYGGARVILEPDAALAAAASVALALGVAKEVRDGSGGTGASLRDLAWDVAGIAASVALSRRTR